MAQLSATDSALIMAARKLAQTACRGHIIDEAPAMRHAIRVSYTLASGVPDVPAWLVGAALLHDFPEFAPDDTDVNRILTEHVGSEGRAIILATHDLHTDLSRGATPTLDTSWTAFLHLFAADQIVAFDSLLTRAHFSGDPYAFIGKRQALINLLPWFRETQQRIAPHLPENLAARHNRKLLDIVHHTAGATAGDNQ